MKEIVDTLGVSSKSIGRWINNYEQQGHVECPTIFQGRPRTLNTAAMADLQELIAESPSLFLNEIAEWLALYHDRPIYTSSLHRTLQDLGTTYKWLRKVAMERDDAERAAWLDNVTSHYTAEQFVFLDESSKDGNTLVRQYGCAPANKAVICCPPQAVCQCIAFSFLNGGLQDYQECLHSQHGVMQGLEL